MQNALAATTAITTARTLALGMNVGIADVFRDVDYYWDRARNCVWQANNKSLANRQTPIGPDLINVSATGGTVYDADGNSYGSVKMDVDGRIYPDNNLGLTSYTLLCCCYIEPGRVTNNRFLLDFGGPCTITSSTNCTYQSLGNGQYIVNFVGDGNDTRMNVSVASMSSAGVNPTIMPVAGSTPYSYDSTRVTTPEEAARWQAASHYARFLNVNGVNNDVVIGDTLTSFAMRTEECARNNIIPVIDRVRWCNEAGIGYWHQVSHRDDLSLVTQQAATIAANLTSPLCFVEYSNEVWNTKFLRQLFEVRCMGVRQGYHAPATSTTNGTSDSDTAHGVYSRSWIDANCQPLTIKSKNQRIETTTSCDLDANDGYFTSTNGIGQVALKALRNLAINTPTPQAYSATKTYVEGDMVWINGVGALAVSTTTHTGSGGPGVYLNTVDYAVGAEVYSNGVLYVSQQNPNLNHSPASSPSYWLPATSSDKWVLPANYAGATPLNWAMIASNNGTDVAGQRWRASQLKKIKAIFDAAFDAAGRQRPIYVVNLQQGATVTGTTVEAQLKNQLDWDGCVDVIDAAVTAPYCGGTTTYNNANGWWSFKPDGTGDLPGLTYADKLGAYAIVATAADADAAVQAVADKMLTASVYQYVTDAEIAVISRRKTNFQGYLNARGRSSKSAIIGTYEGGWVGGLSAPSNVTIVGWPEERAGWNTNTQGGVQWVSTKAYAVDSFAFDGGGNAPDGLTNDDLYRCVTANTGVRPSTDVSGTYWKKVIRCSSGKNRLPELQARLMRHANFGAWAKYRHDAFKTAFGAGYWTNFDACYGIPIEPTKLFSWGFRETTDDVNAPAWAACAQTVTDWA
jgi:hypothetical protein